MKVIILYPEAYEIARFKNKRKEFPPFGVLYLAAVLEKNAINVSVQKVVNEKESLNLEKFDVVMYSLSSSYTYSMMLKSRQESYFSTNCTVLVGGIHASIYPQKTMFDFGSDALIIGEAEEVLIKALHSTLNKTYELIPGVIYADNSNNCVVDYNVVKNLDSLPLPARHLIPEDDYIFNDRLSRKKIRMTHLLGGRGCPYSCYFCGSINKNHRYRKSQSIYDELKMLRERYKIEGFVINDENFIINEQVVTDICEKISVLKMPWSALSRTEKINDKVLKALTEASCIELKFGLESGSNTMLKYMNKKNTIEEAQNALDLCYKYGMTVKLFLIHGFPGENDETTAQTIAF